MLASGSASAQFYPAGDGSGTNNPDLLRGPNEPCQHCAGPVPHEWDAPPFALDWSLSLRGAYVRDKDGEHYEAIVAPSASVKHDFLRGTYSINGSAELSRSTVEDYRVNSLRLGTTGSYQLNDVIGLAGSGASPSVLLPFLDPRVKVADFEHRLGHFVLLSSEPGSPSQ